MTDRQFSVEDIGSDRHMRDYAIRNWGSTAAENARTAENRILALVRDLEVYQDMPSVSPEVKHALERLETAIVAVYDVEAAVHRIVDTRLAEERER